MPLYQYECKKCSKVTESIESLGVKEIICICGNTANKIISLSNFKINGYSEANGYSNSKSTKNYNKTKKN